MDFSKLAEKRIEAAIENGEFDDLALAGQELGDLPSGDLMEVYGYRMMAKAGAVPREVMLQKEITAAKAELKAIVCPDQKRMAMRRLADLQMHLAILLEDRR